MAAGYLTALAGDRVNVLSAGSEPKDQINPAAIDAMAEEGIDIANNVPKILTTDAVKESDVVITMGCGGKAPAPAPVDLHRGVAHPEGYATSSRSGFVRHSLQR